MEAVNTSNSGGNSKQKKMNARVDFTPMVDMIMLLVTFFMLCTTLIKPQTMEISMPSDKEDLKEENQSQIAASKAVTILMDADDKIYYYQGKPSEAILYETTYGKDGIRKELLRINAAAQQKVEALKREYALKRSSNPTKDAVVQAEYKKKLNEIKNSDLVPNVIIKPSETSIYRNMLEVLDEMQICCIGKYVVDKVNDSDRQRIENFKNGDPNPLPVAAE